MRSHGLDGRDHFLALDHFAEHHVFAVEVRRGLRNGNGRPRKDVQGMDGLLDGGLAGGLGLERAAHTRVHAARVRRGGHAHV